MKSCKQWAQLLQPRSTAITACVRRALSWRACKTWWMERGAQNALVPFLFWKAIFSCGPNCSWWSHCLTNWLKDANCCRFCNMDCLRRAQRPGLGLELEYDKGKIWCKANHIQGWTNQVRGVERQNLRQRKPKCIMVANGKEAWFQFQFSVPILVIVSGWLANSIYASPIFLSFLFLLYQEHSLSSSNRYGLINIGFFLQTLQGNRLSENQWLIL